MSSKPTIDDLLLIHNNYNKWQVGKHIKLNYSKNTRLNFDSEPTQISKSWFD